MAEWPNDRTVFGVDHGLRIDDDLGINDYYAVYVGRDRIDVDFFYLRQIGQR